VDPVGQAERGDIGETVLLVARLVDRRGVAFAKDEQRARTELGLRATDRAPAERAREPGRLVLVEHAHGRMLRRRARPRTHSVRTARCAVGAIVRAMEARDRRRVLVGDYVALDRADDRRWEYVNGEAFAMAGGSPEHGVVVGNVFAALKAALRGKPCLALVDEQKIATPRTAAYHYPDGSVVCGDPRYDEHDDHAMTNPTVLVEVLSPTTADYDRGAKFVHYRSLESLSDYILVSIEDRMVEHHHRVAPGQWLMTEVRDGASELTSIDATLMWSDLWVDLERLAR
jgi:Uma2 family endonuclease